MLLTAVFSSITLASTHFLGSKVDVLVSADKTQFSLHVVSRNRVVDLSFGGHGSHFWDNPEQELYMHHTTLKVEPIGSNGDRYLVACIPIGWTSGGVAGTAYVFGMTHGCIKEIGHVDSNQMFSFPIHAPGRRVIAKSFEVGETMCHAAMPRWQEYFVVRNSRLVQITSSKRLYQPWMASLWETLLRYPCDATCWHFYGLAVRGSGSRVEPKSAYRRMLAEEKRLQIAEQPSGGQLAVWLRQQERNDRWPSNDAPGEGARFRWTTR